MEKPALLPPRPETSGDADAGGARGSGRPADVYLPNWDLKGPVAFDLAVTSGMRPGTLASTAEAGDRPVLDYEARKWTLSGSAQMLECSSCRLWLKLVEAVGALLQRGSGRCSGLLCARCPVTRAVETERLQQSLSICLQRENARAVRQSCAVSLLRRRRPP